MADNEIDIVITASSSAEKVIAGIFNVLSDVIDGVSKLTDEFIDYGDQVKKLSVFTGMSNEETSRMIQLADDAFVEFSTLQMSARLLADKGIAPNVESMARLSDQFLRLAPGLVRSQFLMDNFGRAGMEMGKIMELGGEKIMGMSAAISQSMIVDDAKYARILEMKQAQDEFNDSVQGMRFEAADKMLQVFKEMPQWLQKVTLGTIALQDAGMLQGVSGLLISLSSLKNLLPSLTTAQLAFAGSLWATVAPIFIMVTAVGAMFVAFHRFFSMLISMVQTLNKLGGGAAVLEFFRLANPMALMFPGLTQKKGVGPTLGTNSGGLYAKGGTVFGSSSYIVGERGPELFTPSGNGTITPNSRLGGGGGTVVINYQPTFSLADRFELETRLRPILLNAMRGA